MAGDPEIVGRVLAAQGDTKAVDQLIRDYLPFIRAQAGKVSGRVLTEGRDEELGIAMMAFYNAVETYSPSRGAFLKYASVLIRRRLIDYYRREVRHSGQVSLDEPLPDDAGRTMMERLEDESDPYEEMGLRDATRQEILELTAELRRHGLSLSDISDNCPKQERTLSVCREALAYARSHPDMLREVKTTGRLPVARLAEGTGAERKTLERHRKYLVALLLIYSNGYEMIRGHLKQVLTGKGGDRT